MNLSATALHPYPSAAALYPSAAALYPSAAAPHLTAAALWTDPRLVYLTAAAAVGLLLATILLLRRRKKSGRGAGLICLFLSIALHAALIFLVPMLPTAPGGSNNISQQADPEPGSATIAFSTFDPDQELAPEDHSADNPSENTDTNPLLIAPLPITDLADLLSPQPITESPAQPSPTSDMELPDLPSSVEATPASSMLNELDLPNLDSLADFSPPMVTTAELDQAFDQWLDPEPVNDPPAKQPSPPMVTSVGDLASTDDAKRSQVPAPLHHDFAARVGQAKKEAIHQTGGEVHTEAAVAAALRFLCETQLADGSWSAAASGAGIERAPLGMTRPRAGSRCDTAITGLSLLALLGAGHTHHEGEYSGNVYRGLAYLIQNQKPDGSLAGNATLYAANYSHGMASLAMCEAAAITQDPSAVSAATHAIAYSRRMQHPSTGGWRYTRGDPGDLSQLGWQAMVLDAGRRAGVTPDVNSMNGVKRFLQSVRAGQTGGLACYRNGEAVSPTMTAEALATRLLMGEQVPAHQVREAEQLLLRHRPGTGQDNYYYWYYGTLALHQLQDDAWDQWNQSLKTRLLATQRDDGSWPNTTVWGGYGGTLYTTSMATLCLEAYYRHAIRAGVN